MKNILTTVLVAIANIGYAAVFKAEHSETENRVYKSVAASGWSEKNKNRVDPYAPTAGGPGTLDEWCNSPHVHDPACMANAVVMPLQQEIDAVMRHMICLLMPEKCDGEAGDESPEEQSSNDKASASKESHRESQKTNDLKVGSEPRSSGKSEEERKKQGSETKLEGKSDTLKDRIEEMKKQLEGKSETKSSASAKADEAEGKSETKGSASAKSNKDEGKSETKGSASATSNEVEGKSETNGSASAKANDDANAQSKAGDSSWNLKRLRAKAKKHVGNSDESFKKYDKDGDGVMTWQEFELECDSLGVEKQADCKEMFEQVSKGKETASEEDYKDAMGPTSEGDNSWNLKKLRSKARSGVGNSDESFKTYDKDGDGVMTWQEFKLECDSLGVEKEADCKNMFEQMSEGKETISEEDYKDAMGATSEEVARRLRNKFSSSAEAFDAVDSDNDGLVSDWEFYEECSNLADPVDCENLQKKLGHGTTITKEAFEKWMETGHLPSGATVPSGLAGSAPGPAPAIAPSPAMAMAPPLGDVATASATASTNLLGLVHKLENITAKLAQEDQLDPELKNTLERMIDTGKDAAQTLHEMSSLSHHEATIKLEKMVDKAESLDEAVFKFQTEVHPHGYKWWRYRWEYAFVEANILNLLVFVTMFLYMLLHWLTVYMGRFRRDAGVEQKSSIVHLYHSIFTRCLDEANVLGLIAFFIWGLEECGLFVFLVKYLPDNPIVAIVQFSHQMHSSEIHDPHWPTTDQHIIYTLRTVNMHLFLGMIFYYLIMYNITLGAQCTVEQFMKHESRDFYDRFVGSDTGVDVNELGDVDESTKLKAKAAHAVLSHKGWLSQTLSSDRTFKYAFGCFYEDEQFDNFRDYVSEHVQYHEGFEELYKLMPEIPLYPYLGIKLHDGLAKLIVIHWPVWIMVQIVLLLQACGHYFWHLAVVQLLPVIVVLAFFVLACQYTWTRRRAHYVVDPANQVSSKDEGRSLLELKARENADSWILWIQQINLFFLCFSAARFLFSSFFWTDYFRLSCAMLALFVGIYLLFLFVGSLTIPMFMIMFAVPPHVTREDREDLLKVVQRHQPDSARPSRGNIVRGDLRRCSTTYVIP